MEDIYSLIPPPAPPSDEEILQWEYIATHEAAFWLTDWPSQNGEKYFPFPFKRIGKEKIITPIIFNPEDHHIKFQEIFIELETSIIRQELPAKFSNAIKGVCHEVRPWDVLVWGLSKGYILPERLQAYLGCKQFQPKAWPKSKRVLINKIFFQLIFCDNPESDLKAFVEHPWIKKRGYCDSNEKKALKRHLDEAIGFKATRGSKVSKNALKLKPLVEIMETKGQIKEYHIEGLKILLNHVVEHTLERMNEEMDLGTFVEIISGHSVFSLYVQNCPEIIIKMIRKICSNYVGEWRVKYL